MIYKFIIFLLVSCGIVYLSWPSLRSPRLHGFYRFFAFETLLLMILYNFDFWFQNPFSAVQILSWIFLAASLGMAIHGFYLLRVIGQPQGDFENTTRLVRRGVYRYIRHPLYASLLFLGIGAFLKMPSLVGAGMLLALAAFLIATALVEEYENIQRFGEQYRTYMQETKMFIPFVL
ncbi:methyltransferase family protein [Chloroflexota bacterium]